MPLDDSDFGNLPDFHPTHRWFFRSSIYLAIIGGVLEYKFSNSAIDIQLHDTYFVVAHFYVFVTLALIFILFGGVYMILNLFLKTYMNRKLSIFHYILTTIPVVLLVIAFSFQNRFFFDIMIYQRHLFNNTVWILILLFITGQILFVANILYSTIFNV